MSIELCESLTLSLALNLSLSQLISLSLSRGEQVVVIVRLEREDEEETSPQVIAPFFPQVSDSHSFTTSHTSLTLVLPETRRRLVGCDWRP